MQKKRIFKRCVDCKNDFSHHIPKEILDKANKLRESISVQLAKENKKFVYRERETDAFKQLDDGYEKIIVTMDDAPYKVLEKGYRILNLIDFLNNENSLETV